MLPRTVFFGTPEFAVPSLAGLIAAGYPVVGCVTQPDKPIGRKRVVTAPPVKRLAQAHGIPVLQPQTLRQPKPAGQEFLRAFTALRPEIAVVVAYGKIIPADVLAIPRLGFVNVHGSLLPALRGASPIQTAILRGFNRTGITIMQMDEGMDSGPIIAQQIVELDGSETGGSLHDQLSQIGTQALLRALPDYCDGQLVPRQQPDVGITTCGLISKDDGLIDWDAPATLIERQIRAFAPWPGTFTLLQGKRIKILSAHRNNDQLVVDVVQPAGKQPMSYQAFLAGNPNGALPPITC